MITRLEAENFKRLKAVQINPDGSPLVIVGGKNGAGKSSTLDAIEAALGGAKRTPIEPIRKGQKKARVVVETERLTVTRVFTSKGSRLEVRPREDGAVPLTSPQKVLDELVKDLTFDPLAFGRMDAARQTKVLRKLAGLDLDDLDTERKACELERRDVGRDLRRAQGALEKLPVTSTASSSMTVAEILTEIEARERRNDDRNSRRSRLIDMRAQAQTIVGRMDTRAKEIERLQAEQMDDERKLELIRVDGKPLAAEVENLPPDEPIDELKAQLEDAEAVAKQAADKERRSELELELAGYQSHYDELTRKLESFDAVKAEAIEKAEYPISGLEARDDGPYLNGVPWAQASSAEALRASVAIGLALNPELRILLIRDGSLLDEDSIALIRDLAAGAKAQLWIEAVRTDDVCAVVIEDGEVAS